MTQLDRDTQAVFDRLMRAPFTGTMGDLAAAAGMDTERVKPVLARVREPEWVDEHHWTIPYVVRGAAENEWRITDTLNAADNAAMQASQNRRAEEMLQTTRRNIAQAELALAAVGDGRTTAARHWNAVLVSLRATQAHLELVIEDV
jgi:hypothetical protein